MKRIVRRAGRGGPLGLAVAALWIGAAAGGCSRSGPAGASDGPDVGAAGPASETVSGGSSVARAAAGQGDASAGAASRPTGPLNIVIYLIDTLRADHLGVYGYGRRPTSPAIDALARRGIVFEQAYTPAPWTLPAVVSLMTGRYPCEHGVVVDGLKIPADIPTLAEKLKSVGYRTASLISNAYAGRMSGMNRGFDTCRSISSVAAVGPIRKTLTKLRGGPFLLYVHVIDPHNPYEFAPRRLPGFRAVGDETRKKIRKLYRRYRQLSRADYAAKRPIGTTDNTDQQQAMIGALDALRDEYIELYDAAIAAADARLALMLRELRRQRVLKRTIVVVLADHGEEFGEHGGWLHDQSVYEELLRVPLVIRFPGGRFAGVRVAEPVSLVDLMPTLLDAVGHPELAEGVAGRSLMPRIRGAGDRQGEARGRVVGLRINIKKYFRPWKESRGDVNVAVRIGPYKGIWNVEPDTIELYDLRQDLQEQINIAADAPSLAADVRALAQQWYKQCVAGAHQPQGTAGELDERTQEMLHKLGYVD